MKRSEAARLKPYRHECLCGRVYESRYRRRVLECAPCRRRRNVLDANKRRLDPDYAARWGVLTAVIPAWRHFRHIALDLFGPDANLKSSLTRA